MNNSTLRKIKNNEAIVYNKMRDQKATEIFKNVKNEMTAKGVDRPIIHAQCAVELFLVKNPIKQAFTI